MSAPWRHAHTCLLVAIFAVSSPALAIEGKRVTFETDDGLTIAADYYAPRPDATPAPIVILLHMYRSDRTAWKPLIDPLHQAGFAVLAIDMRGHGESATPETKRRVIQRDTALFKAMYHDVRAAYDWLAGQKGVDRARFALVGASVGCSVALQYAARDRSVDAIVCLSPGTHYLGLDSKADIRRIKGRKIWLVAADDAKERQGVEALAPLGESVDAELLAGSAHGTRLFGQVPGLEKRIADYLKKSVGAPGDAPVCGRIDGDVFYAPESARAKDISPSDLRYYSSAEEAETRGLRKADSHEPAAGSRGKRP